MNIKTIIRISELKLPITHTEAELEKEIQKILRLKKQPFTYTCMRQSVDARKKPELFYVYTVDVETAQATSIVKRLHNRKITLTEKKEYAFPYENAAEERERAITGCSRQWPGRAFLRTDACPRRTLPDCARAWSGSRAACAGRGDVLGDRRAQSKFKCPVWGRRRQVPFQMES